MKRFALLFPNFLAGLFLFIPAGCKVGPNYVQPDLPVPDYWYQGINRDLKHRDSRIETWWEAFRDPTLNKLIDRTREANPTLKIAYARVLEARAQRGVAASLLGPTADASGEYARMRTSEALLLPGAGNPSNFFTAGFDAIWEVDVFGGNRRRVEAADASVQAAEESYRDVLITLYAEVALNYVEARSLEERIYLTNENIERQQGAVVITQNRLDAGLVPEIDVTQAKSNLYNSESLIPQFESQLTLTRNRLAALLGGFPGSQDDLLMKSGRIPVPSTRFGYGLPADLLRSRPDIRVAERDLAAQTALIGVATSELYPKFTLFGDFGWDGIDGDNWLKSANRAWTFGPSFRWNLFSSGRIKQSIIVEEARAEQAYYNYENTILAAVAEVETAMVAIVKERQRKAKLDAAVEQTTLTVNKIEDLYTSGLVDFQNVLDAQRSLLLDQDNAAASQGLVARNYIILFKALGGGAPPPKLQEVEEPELKK